MGQQKRIFLLAIFSLFIAISAFAAPGVQVLRFNVEKYKLDNGLTVLLHEDHSVPLVSLQTWFRVGSRDEDVGATGIAHLFEHLMFKGAKRYSGKEFDRILNANGVSNNAFTTHDYTGYYQDAPSNKLELLLDVESDRMENLELTEAGLKSEREVVKEERRMRVDNSVSGVVNEMLWQTAFTKHPYHWPVIGYMADLDAMDVNKLKEFYKMNYSPANAVLVLAGDFNTETAKKLIAKYYGPLRKVDVTHKTVAAEPAQTAERNATVTKKAESEKVMVGYRVANQGHPDSFVLDLISNILSEGPSSRLYKRLVYEKQVATGVAGFNYTPKDPGLLNFFVELKPGVKFKKAVSILDSELDSFKNTVTEAELEKAKNIMMRQWVDAVSTVHGKARALALNEVVTGSYANLFDDMQRYNQITLADIKRVANQYLKPSNRTIINLAPEEKKP